MKGIGIAHGKVILMGEHSVVYGFPAIALPFQEVSVCAEVFAISGEIVLESEYYKGVLANAPKEREHLAVAVYAALDALQKERKKLKIVIQSNLPASRGLGSSAAVAVAVIRAIYDYYQVDLEEEVLIQLAQQAEKIAHGNPSGIDVWTTAFSQLIRFQKMSDSKKKIETLSVELPAALVVADTAIYGETKEAVAKIARQLGERPQTTEVFLQELGSLANQSEKDLAEGNATALGGRMTRAHWILKKLGVSHSSLDDLVETALLEGAFGAKMTGGGLGGCMIALVKDEDAERIADALYQKGAKKVWIYPMKKK